MKHTYKPQGVCSSQVDFELEGNVVKNISFRGGCNGNLKAIAALAEGMTVDQITERVKGITCGFKKTSCSDQLAHALMDAAAKEQV